MPQDSLRSAVYRSFVKCDDPKGVIECKTMRKSKTSSRGSDGIYESGKITNDFNSSISQLDTGKGKKIDFISAKQETIKPSSFQLNEVSKGAEKLNQVIDTYSNGMRFDRHSKEIAKDLLKGALDLQESLMVLGKLQEASNYMAKFKKKPKEKPYKSEKEEQQMRIGRSKSDRYADYNYQTGFQQPRVSINGSSSRDCYDELRTVIRDSLARQNLLPPNFIEKLNFSEKKMLDSMVDIPSTSSTQSSTMNFVSFTSSDTSFSSESTKRSKGSNLIAKLMGLEEIPAQQGFISSPKRFELEKISGQRRPPFEIDMANAKKPQFGAYSYRDDTEEKKLRDIVETMRYKGLLKGNSSEKLRTQSNYSDSKKVLVEDALPIVIMKPMNVSRDDLEENDSQKLVRKLGKKEIRAQTKEEQYRGAVDFDEVCRRLRGEATSTKREGFREFKEKEISKLRASSAPIDQKEKKKASEKKLEKKTAEMETSRSKSASKSRDQAKLNSIREKNTEAEPITRKRSVSPQKSTPPMVISKQKPPLAQKGGERKKKPKLVVQELLTDPLVDEDVKHKQIDHRCEDEREEASVSTATAAQLLTREETEASEGQIKDNLESAKVEIITKPNDETSFLISHNRTIENKCLEKQTEEMKLFLTSPSFFKYAEELFDIEATHENSQIQSTNSISLDTADEKLLLDCANELMLQKKLNNQIVRPPFFAPKCSKIHVSITQLVDEVCKGIKDLSSYREYGVEKLITETLYSVLERDMLGKGLAWELGWRHGYCFDEVEQVVGDIDNRILNELIEVVITDFLLLAV